MSIRPVVGASLMFRGPRIARLDPRRNHVLAFALPLLCAAFGCGGSSGLGSSTSSPTGATGVSVSATPANITGAYTLTLTASSVCTQLPVSARSRQYAAAMTQSGSEAAANLTGVGLFDQRVSAQIIGTSAIFIIVVGDLNLNTGEGLVVGGTSTVQVSSSPASISGDLNGEFHSVGLTDRTCTAANHRFSFARR